MRRWLYQLLYSRSAYRDYQREEERYRHARCVYQPAVWAASASRLSDCCIQLAYLSRDPRESAQWSLLAHEWEDRRIDALQELAKLLPGLTTTRKER